MNRTYTVIATSGYQGDQWQYISEHNTRKAALDAAKDAQRTDAQSVGYIVGVIGETTIKVSFAI